MLMAPRKGLYMRVSHVNWRNGKLANWRNADIIMSFSFNKSLCPLSGLINSHAVHKLMF